MAVDHELPASPARGGVVGRRIAGPVGARARLARRLDVLAALAESDMRARYGRGRWQAVKWLADPFAALGIYLLLVVFVLEVDDPAPGLSLACAIVPFQLVMMSVVNGLGAVQLRRSIIQNMRFDRTLIPASSVITESVAWLAALTLLPLMMAVYTVAPTPALLWLPAVLALTIVVSLALAYPATLIGVWFPDLRPFAVSLIRTLYFVAPGLVALDAIRGEKAAALIKVNPLTGIFEAYRDIFLYGQRPAAWEFLYPLGIAALVLVVAIPVYGRDQQHFAKVVE
jgi:ABC-type polysaccharide/polyol phosphate export permease